MALTSSSKYLRCLSVWIGFVALMAMGNTLQCFINHSFLAARLYTNEPERNVTGLTARLFGIWTLLSAALRFACAINIYNKAVYHLTFFSFFLALGHFTSEIFPFKTAELTIGVCAPLIVSSFSIVVMAVGYRFPGESSTKAVLGESTVLAKKAKFS